MEFLLMFMISYVSIGYFNITLIDHEVKNFFSDNLQTFKIRKYCAKFISC